MIPTPPAPNTKCVRRDSLKKKKRFTKIKKDPRDP